jgi:hypothetical protein
MPGVDPNIPYQFVWRVSPTIFRNSSVTLVSHAELFTAMLQFGMSACETCYTRRYASQFGSFPSSAGIDWSFDLFLSVWNSEPVMTEGMLTFYENDYENQVSQYLTPEQRLNQNYFYNNRRILTAILNLGYWAPNGTGWVDDDECALYNQEHAYFPSATFAAARAKCAAIRTAPVADPVTIWYMNGMQYFRDWFAEAQFVCGTAFDPQYFISMMFAHNVNPLAVTERIYRDYIDSGCQQTLTVRGDCWRNVAPPKPTI